MEITTIQNDIKSNETIIKLNKIVALGLSATVAIGFEKAFLMANAVRELKTILTDEYMKPIMFLQGSKLGFKTDKDKEGGYSVDVVRTCLIEAVLMGLSPTGNQFNIIGGNAYFTKEGTGVLLSKVPGLHHEIVPSLPEKSADGKSASIKMKIIWNVGSSEKQEREIPFSIRINFGMGDDAIIGKATRKSRAWLYGYLTNNEIGEGDVEDAEFTDVSSKKPLVVSTITDDVLKDWQIQINDCTTEEMLTNLRKNSNEKRPQIIAMFIEREKQLKESK